MRKLAKIKSIVVLKTQYGLKYLSNNEDNNKTYLIKFISPEV